MVRLPQLRVPAMVEVPLTVSVQTPCQKIEPSNQCLTTAPLIAIWPEPFDQTSTLEQERSPAGRHHDDPGQLAVAPEGALEQGAANQVRLFGESAPALGGQA